MHNGYYKCEDCGMRVDALSVGETCYVSHDYDEYYCIRCANKFHKLFKEVKEGSKGRLIWVWDKGKQGKGEEGQ